MSPKMRKLALMALTDRTLQRAASAATAHGTAGSKDVPWMNSCWLTARFGAMIYSTVPPMHPSGEKGLAEGSAFSSGFQDTGAVESSHVVLIRRNEQILD